MEYLFRPFGHHIQWNVNILLVVLSILMIIRFYEACDMESSILYHQ